MQLYNEASKPLLETLPPKQRKLKGFTWENEDTWTGLCHLFFLCICKQLQSELPDISTIKETTGRDQHASSTRVPDQETSCCVHELPLLWLLPNVCPWHEGPMLYSIFGSRPVVQISYIQYTKALIRVYCWGTTSHLFRNSYQHTGWRKGALLEFQNKVHKL